MNQMMKSLAFVLAVAATVLTSYYLKTPITSAPTGNDTDIALHSR